MKHIESDVFACDECDKSFNQEWKLNAHKNTHKMHTCEQCDKTFKYQNLMEIHKQIAHEGKKLYCHFYNNDDECPNDEQCVFLHEKAGPCKYGDGCERDYCMYEHDFDDEDEESEDDAEDEKEKTFCNPSQSEDSDSEGKTYKCDMCQFFTEDKKRFKRHKFESHSVSGKYACMECEQQFETRKLFNNHKYFAH